MRYVIEPTQDPYGHPGFDPSKPHVMGFTADEASLREDMLSTSEVFAALYLSCLHIVKPGYKRHRIAPVGSDSLRTWQGPANRSAKVTLLSASARNVRIIQGIVDAKEGTMEVRTSPIVSFETGVAGNHEQFLVLLGWLLGKPVGKTT